MLHGRSDEIAQLSELLTRSRARHSAALVVRGEAGIGKSALLDHLAANAPDARVLRASGAQFEAELPFAGLHMLLRGHLDALERLPEAQARALSAALGLSGEGAADRFLVGLGLLTLLAELAEDTHLLCLVDDAHWLDSASAEALLFAARRLEAEGVVVVFAARDSHAPEFPAAGLPELSLSSLGDSAAAELLAAAAADLPSHVREQIRAASGGNPLALRELSAAQREGQLSADSYGLKPLPTHSRIQRTFADRIAVLDESTRALLVVAAADDTYQLSIVLAAAEKLGATMADIEIAERRELLRSFGTELRFRHPLIRAAAYQDAPLSARLAAHRALAGVLEDAMFASQRAWHLAAATTGADESVASELDRTADAALRRGGYAAVAAALERAGVLSPDPADRGRRLLGAAQAALDAGQLDNADQLAECAAADLTDPASGADIAVVRGIVADWQGAPMTAYRMWTEAAAEVVDHAEYRASFLQFNAVEVAWTAGEFDAVAEAAEWSEKHGLSNAHLVRNMARVVSGLNGHAGLHPRDAVAALRKLWHSGCDSNTPKQTAAQLWWQMLLGDHEGGYRTAAALVAECRSRGALGVLPRALALLARAQAYRGRVAEARAAATEARDLVRHTGRGIVGIGVPLSVLAYLAALTGDEAECHKLIRGAGIDNHDDSIFVVDTPLALLDLGMGRHAEALERLSALADRKSRMDMLPYVPDLVEAAVRLGRPERAREAFAWFSDWALAVGHPWAEAVVERCRALLDDETAPEHFARATALHAEPGGRPFEEARTALVYAEWLRRERRPAAARPLLRSALEIFERMGAAPWAERARAELRASGESTAAGTRPDVLSSLTPQEFQVVRMAAQGLTNRDIGAQLFLSPRTVGYHLYKAYPKLGVASRAELAKLDLPSGV